MDNQMLLQILDTMAEQERNICDLARNDLLLIELSHSQASPEAIHAAASAVRSTLYSADALADRIRLLSQQLRGL